MCDCLKILVYADYGLLLSSNYLLAKFQLKLHQSAQCSLLDVGQWKAIVQIARNRWVQKVQYFDELESCIRMESCSAEPVV